MFLTVFQVVRCSPIIPYQLTTNLLKLTYISSIRTNCLHSICVYRDRSFTLHINKLVVRNISRPRLFITSPFTNHTRHVLRECTSVHNTRRLIHLLPDMQLTLACSLATMRFPSRAANASASSSRTVISRISMSSCLRRDSAFL